MTDQTLTCTDCGQLWTWSSREQDWFQQHNLRETPKRCRLCRSSKRERYQGAEERVCAVCYQIFRMPKDLVAEIERKGWTIPLRCRPCRQSGAKHPRQQP